MQWRSEWKPLALIVAAFLVLFFVPLESTRVRGAIFEAFYLAQWYAREHIILCLIPAFFIAGAIAVFVSQASVMKYLGAGANKVLAYGVASVSGSILAVCSCTVLPLFAGIYRMGAGLGPASAFLYSGPAINVLAMVLTARVLGLELGIARAVGAVLFSVIVGLLMHLIFRREEQERVAAQIAMSPPEVVRSLWQTTLYFAAMIAILIFANWGKPGPGASSFIYDNKWLITGLAAAGLGLILIGWFRVPWVPVLIIAIATAVIALALPDQPLFAFSAAVIGLSLVISRGEGEAASWFAQTWGYTKQILPLLLGGILVAGLALGRPGQEGLIPSQWVSSAVGGNTITANFLASVIGAFMYFATLTEVPIVQGLIGNGMGKGPALALLLAGPALSLPSMLVLGSILGVKKTVVFVSLVVVLATLTGILYGLFF